MKLPPNSTNKRRLARQALGTRTQRRRNTGLFPRMVGTGKVAQGKINPSKKFKGKEHQLPRPSVLVEAILRAQVNAEREGK